MSVDSRLIVALDYDSMEESIRLVDQLQGVVGFYKIGKQLFSRVGPEGVRQLRARGVDVFLDLKFHDIPETVKKAVRSCVDLEVRFLTIHTSGGSEMMKAAFAGAQGSQTTILGVTVLTSMNDAGIRELGIDRTAQEQVIHLARLAIDSGLQGLVCSPQEVSLIRQKVSPTVQLVTPGIRSSEDAVGDQKRTLTPSQAIQAGSNYLVVGRPITQAVSPVEAARKILHQMNHPHDGV